MAAGAVDFLRGLLGWWNGNGASVTPPDTVDIAYKAGDKRVYYQAGHQAYWKAADVQLYWKAEQ